MPFAPIHEGAARGRRFAHRRSRAKIRPHRGIQTEADMTPRIAENGSGWLADWRLITIMDDMPPPRDPNDDDDEEDGEDEDEEEDPPVIREPDE